MARTSSSLISAMEMLLISMLDVASLRSPTDAIRCRCIDPLAPMPPPEDGVHGGGVVGSTVWGGGTSLGAPSFKQTEKKMTFIMRNEPSNHRNRHPINIAPRIRQLAFKWRAFLPGKGGASWRYTSSTELSMVVEKVSSRFNASAFWKYSTASQASPISAWT